MTLKNQHEKKMNRRMKKICKDWIFFIESNYLNSTLKSKNKYSLILGRIATNNWRKQNLKVTSINSFSNASMASKHLIN